MPYKFSNFVVAYQAKDKLLIHSTLSRKTIATDLNSLAMVLNDTSYKLHNDLKKGCFILDSRIDESLVVKHHLFSNPAEPVLRLIVLITQCCNFHCVYCYQHGILPRRPSLNEDDTKRLKDWILSYLGKNSEIQRVQVCLFGGEPLLIPSIIDCLRKELLCVGKKVSVGYQVVTNGSLVDSKIINLLAQMDVQCIELTIDGPAPLHNKRRPYQNGAPSYDDVFEGLLKLAYDAALVNTHLILRVNVDTENISSLDEWLSELKKNLPSKRVEIVFSPVIDSVGYQNAFKLPTRKLINKLNQLYQLCKRIGFLVQIETGHLCTYEYQHQFVFDSSLNIFKCNAAVGIEEFQLGNIHTPLEELDAKIHLLRGEKLKKIKIKACQNCRYLPYCRGGCRYQSYIRKEQGEQFLCRSAQYNDLILGNMILNGYADEESVYTPVDLTQLTSLRRD